MRYLAFPTLTTCTKCGKPASMTRTDAMVVRPANVASIEVEEVKLGNGYEVSCQQPIKSRRHCFEVLGLDSSATSEEVTASYGRLALNRHPNRGGDPDDFKRLRRHFEQAFALAEWRLFQTL